MPPTVGERSLFRQPHNLQIDKNNIHVLLPGKLYTCAALRLGALYFYSHGNFERLGITSHCLSRIQRIHPLMKGQEKQ